MYFTMVTFQQCCILKYNRLRQVAKHVYQINVVVIIIQYEWLENLIHKLIWLHINLLIRNRNSRRDLSVAFHLLFHSEKLTSPPPPPIARVAWLVAGTNCPWYDLPWNRVANNPVTTFFLAMVHWLFDTSSATNIILKVHRLPANRNFVFNYRKLVAINGAIIRVTTFTFYHNDIYPIYICVWVMHYIYYIYIYISVWELKNFHHNHKTIVKQSYSYKGNLYSGKLAYLYWNDPQVVRDTFMTNATDVAAIICFVV